MINIFLASALIWVLSFKCLNIWCQSSIHLLLPTCTVLKEFLNFSVLVSDHLFYLLGDEYILEGSLLAIKKLHHPWIYSK